MQFEKTKNSDESETKTEEIGSTGQNYRSDMDIKRELERSKHDLLTSISCSCLAYSGSIQNLQTSFPKLGDWDYDKERSLVVKVEKQSSFFSSILGGALPRSEIILDGFPKRIRSGEIQLVTFFNSAACKVIIACKGVSIDDFDVIDTLISHVQQKVINDFQDFEVSFTGHSLGGFLAAYLAIKFNCKAVVFDLPRMDLTEQEKLLKRFNGEYNHQQLVTCYALAPNAINYGKNHIGTWFHIPEASVAHRNTELSRRLIRTRNGVNFIKEVSSHIVSHVFVFFNEKLSDATKKLEHTEQTHCPLNFFYAIDDLERPPLRIDRSKWPTADCYQNDKFSPVLLRVTYATNTHAFTLAQKGNLKELTELITSEQFSLLATNKAGKTVLHIIAERGFTDGLLGLLDCYGDPNITSKNQPAPIALAVIHGRRVFVKVFLDYSDWSVQEVVDQYALVRLAAQYGHIPILELFDKYKVSLIKKDSTGLTPLMVAVQYNKSQAVAKICDLLNPTDEAHGQVIEEALQLARDQKKQMCITSLEKAIAMRKRFESKKDELANKLLSLLTLEIYQEYRKNVKSSVRKKHKSFPEGQKPDFQKLIKNKLLVNALFAGLVKMAFEDPETNWIPLQKAIIYCLRQQLTVIKHEKKQKKEIDWEKLTDVSEGKKKKERDKILTSAIQSGMELFCNPDKNPLDSPLGSGNTNKNKTQTLEGFCRYFEMEFMNALTALEVVARGHAHRNTTSMDENIKIGKQAADLIPNLNVSPMPVPIPYVNLNVDLQKAVKAGINLYEFFYNRRLKQEALRAAKLFETASIMQKAEAITEAADRLANRFRDQIMQLQMPGIEKFAKVCAARAISYIILQDASQIDKQPNTLEKMTNLWRMWMRNGAPRYTTQFKSAVKVIIDGVIYAKAPSVHLENRLHVIDATTNEGWTAEGIITQTSIRTQDGKLYSDNIIQKSDIQYGVCHATEDEAKHRSFQLVEIHSRLDSNFN